jgi:hypothetical protein
MARKVPDSSSRTRMLDSSLAQQYFSFEKKGRLFFLVRPLAATKYQTSLLCQIPKKSR